MRYLGNGPEDFGSDDIYEVRRKKTDLSFDLSRSLEVKANGAKWKGIYDLLFNFTGNHGPICKRFQFTTLWNMRDLDFDLSRSL